MTFPLWLPALLLVAQGDARPTPDEGEQPLALGQLLGAQGAVKVRAGLWFANLSPGPMTVAFDNIEVDSKLEAIGRGTGVLRDLGLSLTIGDYDFALGIISDELLAPATDAIGNDVAATIIQQLVGQIRTRALRELFGTEVWATVRYGDFDGPLDASTIAQRDGQVYFAGKDARWDTPYLSIETGAREAGFLDGDLFFRFTHFSMPSPLAIPLEASNALLSLQTATVWAGGVGLSWEDTADFGWFEVDGRFAGIPFTGFSAVSFGEWGTLYGLLLEANARVAVAIEIEIGGAIALRPYAAFEASLVSPVVLTLSVDDLYAPNVAMPDWVVWGPQVGLEVRL